MEKRVVITGMGVISPIGNDIPAFWNSLIEGRSGIDKLVGFDATDFTCKIAAEVKDFEPNKYIDRKLIRRTDRFAQFALAAGLSAVKDAGLDMEKEDPYKVGVIIGSGIGGLHSIEEQHKILLEKGPSKVSPFLIPMLIINIASGQISILLGAKGPNSSVVTACATSSHAIGDSFEIIKRGEAEVMISGGAEAAITPLSFGGFCALKAMSVSKNDNPKKAPSPFDKERDGFVMGEGGGIVVLESLEHAKKRGANIYAEIVGYAMTGDAYHITAPAPDGAGPALCMKKTLKKGQINPEDVDYINAHAPGTVFGDGIETKAIKNALGDAAYKVAISSTKSITGHLLGAAGAIELITAILTIKNGVIPPTINYKIPDPECDLDYVPNKAREKKVSIAMSNSFGFGGHNASLLLKNYEK